MSAAHTPGPWAVFGNGHCVGGANTDPTTIAEHPSAGIAMCGMARRLPEECEANARLIAAAPDLLEALIAIRDATLGGKSLTAAEAAAWDKGWAAIAKAAP